MGYIQRAAPQEFNRVPSSMCARPHPAARRATERFFAANPGDPATYQTIVAPEEDALSYLGGITGLPVPHDYMVSGGTEVNIQAIRATRNYIRDDDPNVIAPENIHFSLQKVADVLDAELRVVPVNDDYRANAAAVREVVDDHTVLVAGVTGTTELGRADPIPELTTAAHDVGALMHVNAAWGGFVLLFANHEWSFTHAPVDSTTIDFRKYGQAVILADGPLFRDKSVVDSLVVDTSYLESASQTSLTRIRSGTGVASAAAAMCELWPDGYRDAYERQQANADWLYDELRARDYDAVEPELPLVVASVPDEQFDSLRDPGWRTSRTTSGELRIVCMPHVSRGSLRSFLSDLDNLWLGSTRN